MVVLNAYRLPYDVIKPMLLEAAVDLRSSLIYRVVSLEFKAVADSPSFLHALLVKFKGDQYKNVLYAQNPKNFFFIERDLLRSVKKHEKLQFISSIGLRSLALRSFLLNTSYFRFSSSQIESLRTLSCMDQNDWDTCIESMTEELTKFEFPLQLLCRMENECVPTFEKIESVYQQPNTVMQRLIKEFALTDIYFGEPDLFIIHTEDKTFHPIMLEEAIMEPKEYERMIFINEMEQLIEVLKIFMSPGDPPQLRIGISHTPFKKIADQLKDATKTFKKDAEKAFPSDEYKFLFGYLFPEIWPDSLRELGEQEQSNAFNYWIIHFFIKSIDVEKGTDDQPSKLLCNYELCRFIYDDLKNSRSGLKEFIEQAYKTPHDFAFFRKFFPGVVWAKQLS